MPHRIHVNPGAWSAPETLLEAGVRSALEGAGVAEAEVSVTLVGDDAIAELSRTYLGRDEVTDVLAFSLGDGVDVLGDVYVCRPQAARQAEDAGVALDEELVRLAVHGALHLLGHDHPEGSGRWESPMFRRQEEIVRAVLGRDPEGEG